MEMEATTTTSTTSISQVEKLVNDIINKIADIEDKIHAHHSEVEHIRWQILDFEYFDLDIEDIYLSYGLTSRADLEGYIDEKLAAVAALEEERSNLQADLAHCKTRLEHLESLEIEELLEFFQAMKLEN